MYFKQQINRFAWTDSDEIYAYGTKIMINSLSDAYFCQ